MNKQIADELNKPLVSTNVKQREQGGIKLSYIESWHAIAEANRIFGWDGWTRQTQDLQLVQAEQKGDKGLWYVSYLAKSLVTVHGIAREGMGFGQGIDRDLGKAHESAVKEAESDAMKRALMTFGNPFGLALYDKTQANVVKEMTKPGGREGISRCYCYQVEAHGWQAFAIQAAYDKSPGGRAYNRCLHLC
jgi:DNA repair and recombination protein RAD52